MFIPTCGQTVSEGAVRRDETPTTILDHVNACSLRRVSIFVNGIGRKEAARLEASRDQRGDHSDSERLEQI
jgi:hypothetical protein